MIAWVQDMLAQLLPLPGLPPLFEIIALLILLVIGLLILVLIIKVIFLFLPAAIVAIVVWFLTGSLFWAGVAFLIIAVISIIGRR
jgi:hypothetical protein